MFNDQLEKVLREYENILQRNLPPGTTETEKIIHHHTEQREYINRVYEEVVHLGDSIINRIRQNYPQSIDLETFHTSIKDKRDSWDRIWHQQNELLQSHLNVTKLRKDAEEVIISHRPKIHFHSPTLYISFSLNCTFLHFSY